MESARSLKLVIGFLSTPYNSVGMSMHIGVGWEQGCVGRGGGGGEALVAQMQQTLNTKILTDAPDTHYQTQAQAQAPATSVAEATSHRTCVIRHTPVHIRLQRTALAD